MWSLFGCPQGFVSRTAVSQLQMAWLRKQHVEHRTYRLGPSEVTSTCCTGSLSDLFLIGTFFGYTIHLNDLLINYLIIIIIYNQPCSYDSYDIWCVRIHVCFVVQPYRIAFCSVSIICFIAGDWVTIDRLVVLVYCIHDLWCWTRQLYNYNVCTLC